MSLTIALSYYNQCEILKKHVDTWINYPENIKSNIQFFIIDDCSKIPANEVLKDRDLSKLNIHIYRVEVDLYCNIAGVRNLGAKECSTTWLLILDMDTLINLEMIIKVNQIITKNKTKEAYRFNRRTPGIKNHPKNNKIHPAICLIRKDDYWKIGGCEEDLVGHYGGTDPSFWYKARWDKKDRIINLINCKDIYITYIPEGEADIIRDTSHNIKLVEEKKRTGKWSTEYIRFPWKRILIFDN